MPKFKFPPAFFCFFILCAAIQALMPDSMKVLCAANMSDYLATTNPLAPALRLISYQFIHASWSHCLGNFFFAAPFAMYVENKLGSKKFILAWLLTGASSALTFLLAFSVCLPVLIIGGVVPVQLVGASGSISGILFFALLLFGKEAGWWKKVLAVSGGAFFFLPQFFMALISQLTPLGIAYWGHVGGFIGAALLAHCLKASAKEGSHSRR